MCQHYPEAQVAVRTVCCRKFFDCPTCHETSEDHPLKKTLDLSLICKKCRKAFRKDLRDFDAETDSYCPNCDNEFVLVSAGSVAAAKPLDELQASEPVRPDHLKGLDARMIRDEDINDEDFGIETDFSRRLG